MAITQAAAASVMRVPASVAKGPNRRLTEDGARPIIFNYRLGTCHYPQVHGITVMVNSLFNGWRFEDAWRDQ